MKSHARRIKLPLSAALSTVFALTGCASNPASTTPPSATAASHAITFAVAGHGTAALTWPGGTTTHAALPWHATSHIPLGADGVTLSVQLDAVGGLATCSITVDGKAVTTSLAEGPNGRATCHTGAGQADG